MCLFTYVPTYNTYVIGTKTNRKRFFWCFFSKDSLEKFTLRGPTMKYKLLLHLPPGFLEKSHKANYGKRHFKGGIRLNSSRFLKWLCSTLRDLFV